jgi:hypothetical protein
MTKPDPLPATSKATAFASSSPPRIVKRRITLPAVIRLLGKPPLLKGEKPADFYGLLEHLATEFEPATVSEWLLLHDLTVNTWTQLRFRRAQTSLFLLTGSSGDIGPKIVFSDFRPRDSEDRPPPQPDYSKPIFKKIRRRPPRPPTDSEMGAALKDKMDIFERSEDIIGTLDRRDEQLRRQLKQLKAERKANTSKLIDVNAEDVNVTK